MTEFTAFLTDANIVNFLLLFIRIGAVFVFYPFFNSTTFFPTIKAAFALIFSVVLYPLTPPLAFEPNAANTLVAVITEIFFGMAIGFLLSAIFSAMQLAGELISFVMGFSMASSFDPQSGVTSTLMSRFTNYFALMLFVVGDFHHSVIAFVSSSVASVHLGAFLFNGNFLGYAIKSMASLFVIGFSVGFPIVALSLLSDIIFGMIMKTMPSFNLLVIGFPVKIAIAFLVLVIVLSSMAVVFKQELSAILNVIYGMY
ncbi:MAG: flagellar biosynthetic protein FliR [Helicobacteraceae bacterium]